MRFFNRRAGSFFGTRRTSPRDAAYPKVGYGASQTVPARAAPHPISGGSCTFAGGLLYYEAMKLEVRLDCPIGRAGRVRGDALGWGFGVGLSGWGRRA